MRRELSSFEVAHDHHPSQQIGLRNGDRYPSLPPLPQLDEIVIEIPNASLSVQGNQGAVGGKHST